LVDLLIAWKNNEAFINMKILYLYAEIMGYTMATMRKLIELYATEIHVVHWEKKKVTPYQHGCDSKITFFDRADYSSSTIKDLVRLINPDLAVVSGWLDKKYLPAARMLKKKGVPVVTGLDEQWHGSIKQYIAASLCFLLKRYFSHVWVAGPYQYEYARRIGFKKSEIIFNLYSADLETFNDAYMQNKSARENNYPHRFLFVGRFEKMKGVDLLAEVWHIIGVKKKDWELHFIGNGSLKSNLKTQDGVVVHDFMQPDQLKKEIQHYGCFILPSRREPWGVVIQEIAAAGLPIICSDSCGAAPVFLIHGLNGFKFKSGDICSLSSKMLNIINTSDRDLCRMSDSAHEMGQHITPSLSAASLISVVKK
jgi:glycosyltransferase involved in cell wall biosynthesis